VSVRNLVLIAWKWDDSTLVVAVTVSGASPSGRALGAFARGAAQATMPRSLRAGRVSARRGTIPTQGGAHAAHGELRPGHSVPRPAFGGAVLTLLRLRRVARLRRRPELDRASRPLHRAGSWSLRGRKALEPCGIGRVLSILVATRRHRGFTLASPQWRTVEPDSESGGRRFESFRARHLSN
jgi:hypothetical protein